VFSSIDENYGGGGPSGMVHRTTAMRRCSQSTASVTLGPSVVSGTCLSAVKVMNVVDGEKNSDIRRKITLFRGQFR